MLAAIDGWEAVGEANDGVDALTAAATATPDVVLLDIRMPRMDGIETARHLAALDTPPAIIFTSAYDEYALAAFDAHAVAYLLKPVRAERRVGAKDDFEDEGGLRGDAARRRARIEGIGDYGEDGPGALRGALREAAPRRHIAARVGERLELLPIDRVLAFVADSKYVSARHAGGELLLDETLKELEHEFADAFVRVHRNTRGHSAPVEVSRRQTAEVRRRLRGR